MAKGDWWLKLDINEWLNDPKLRRLRRENRDSWLTACLMMTLEGEFQIKGTRDEIANLLHLTAEEFDLFIDDLKRTNVADVTLRNDCVTLVSRRYKKEAKSKEQTKLRVRRLRGNADVTPQKRDIVKSKSNKKEERIRKEGEGETPPLARPPADLKFEDSAFDHPAVVVYQEKFGVKCGTHYAKEVAARVKDMGTWLALISDKIAMADEPLDTRRKIATWFLKAYDERVAEKANGRGGGFGKPAVATQQPFDEIGFQKLLSQQEAK